MKLPHHPRATLALLLSVSSCHMAPRKASRPQAEGRRVGDYRGYREVSESIQRHLVGNKYSSFSLGSYIGIYSNSSYSPNFEGLLSLLGGYSGSGANNSVQGGEPNAMTMMLWDTTFSGLASDIGALCTPMTNERRSEGMLRLSELDAGFARAVTDLCSWPAPEAMTGDHLEALWTATCGYEVSDDEKAAWISGVLAPDSGFATLKGGDAVRAIARSMLLNPHYLLEE